ncbi:cytochrome c oxidase subunit I [Salinarimonas rosea]|uniref:cytochrome c oxidase subunit I n=1 Tax=Salinarimonas rosea TaxID=552063 RepID=UPI0003FD9CBF|nr:cytochrome c oxidase subunit I [Salinarimonas rosea]
MTDPIVAARRARAIRLHRALAEVWDTPPGLPRLAAVNHTIVGRRFMLTALVFFVAAGILAMLVRTQLALPGNDVLGPEAYAQVVTTHGTVMMFLFAIPFIEGMALYLLPKLLGARDLAFPRLSAFGYWCYLFGGTTVLGSIVFGAAPDGGWFMYTPLTTKPYSPGIGADVWLLGITFVEVSAIAAAVEIVVTILKVRAPGMSLGRMPLMAWYLLVTAFMILGGFPPLILGSILLEVERAFGWPFFDPERGGDPLLWQHLFWLFGHPEVYIIFIPAAGVISTVLPVFARRPIVGYSWVVAAVVAVGFLSFGLWVHHMFATGLPRLSLAFFSAASLLVTVPQAVQIFAWLATLAKGRPVLTLPMLYILGFFFVFVAGGLTGVMVAVVPFDEQVHDTHFVVAHLHYVLIGGFVLPAIAGLYYWLPQASGRLPVFGVGKTAFWLIFAGFNLTFLVMHWTGLLGMPRRVFTYAPGLGWDVPNLVSSIGSFVLTAGFALVALDIFLQLRHGRSFRRDPWNAGTLEWAMPTPPAPYNFASLPHVSHRDPLHADPALPQCLAAGEGYLGRVREGRLETLCVSMVEAEPEQILVLPNRDYTPLWTALALAVFFGAMLAGLYWLAPAGLVLTLVFAWRWAASDAAPADPPPEDAGRGVRLPLHVASARPPAWWGLVFLLLADAILFASLAFGTVFLAAFAAAWPAASPPLLSETAGIVAAVSVAVAGVAAPTAALANRRGGPLRTVARDGLLALSAAASLAALAALAWIATGLAPAAHAHDAVVGALLAYGALHVLIGLVASLFALAQLLRGYASSVRRLPVEVASLWQLYTGATGLVALALAFLAPEALR